MLEPVKRPYHSPLREESARRTRAQIRVAAARLFVQQGYTATTIRQVAQVSGVAERTVYAAYPGKFELFHDVLDVATAGDELPVPVADRPEFLAALEERDGRRAIEMFAGYGAALLDRAAALILTMTESAGADEDMRRLSEGAARVNATNFATFAQALVDHGALRPGLGAAEAADVLFALGSPHVHQLLRRDRGWTTQRYRAWLEDTLDRTLLRADG